MTILLVVLCIWGASALIRAYSAKQSQREFQRIDSEIRQRKLEQKQMAQELAQQKRDAELYVKKQIELERQQIRERKEREAADARLAKEQAKLSARVEKLEWTVESSANAIADLDERIADLYGQLDSYLLEQAGMVPGSKSFNKQQDKIVVKREQIRKAEKKRRDLKHTHDMAERELSA